MTRLQKKKVNYYQELTPLAYRFRDQINQNKILIDDKLSAEITKESDTLWTACITDDYGFCNLCYAELNQNTYRKEGQRCDEFELIVNQENLTYYKDKWTEDVIRYTFIGDSPRTNYFITETSLKEGLTYNYRLPLSQTNF